MRKTLVLLHRYIGLTMTIFLVIVGLTGSVLAFYHELDKWLNPTLLTVEPSTQPSIDVLSIRERMLKADPRIRIDYVPLHREPHEAVNIAVQPKIDPATQKEYELGFTDAYVNPYTGETLGKREWGKASLAKENILPFLYRLHYSLALPKFTGNIGGYTLGIVALLWTLDCFFGFYLTLPLKWRVEETPVSRSWWTRWKPAWFIKRSRFNFDLHRASGLWVWAMLFVFAWSSVAFNLNEVFKPTMQAAFQFREELPLLQTPIDTPQFSFAAAREAGIAAMRELGQRRAFEVEHEEQLSLDRDRGVYIYTVRSNADSGKWGMTSVAFDANTGALRDESWPGNERSGDTVGRWLTLLHMAAVFGLPMKIFVCVMGVVIVALSVTGVVIWWRKTRVRVKSGVTINLMTDPINDIEEKTK